MRVAVTAATKHGATAEIANAIADTLAARGHMAVVADPDAFGDLARFDAFVVGSAVYMGNWLEPAKRLLERLGEERADRPVWLFSSGPLGSPPKPEGDPVEATGLLDLVDARGHTVFAGKLDRSRLSFAERSIVRMVRAPEGDDRDWSAIEAWATQIADSLQPAGRSS